MTEREKEIFDNIVRLENALRTLCKNFEYLIEYLELEPKLQRWVNDGINDTYSVVGYKKKCK